MPLIDLWKADKSSILKMTIEQISSIAGDGRLLDFTDCQNELRQYLSEASTDSLADYANYCLENAFTKSGQVLQDVINELGRRLEYSVENGRYQGVKNAIGFDGIWADEKDWSLVVEVKTTDAYRLSLDTVAKYRISLINEGKVSELSSVLIVVGRTDTGELEAQVRGSKHAWHFRIIGIDSLINLVRVKESADSQETIRKIRTLLTPLEYTRLDELIDVVFAATKDVEESVETSETAELEILIEQQNHNDRTPKEEIAELRNKIVLNTSNKFDESLIKKTRALYWSANHKNRLACTISKRYTTKGSAKYWYAYHPAWDGFLNEGNQSSIALGCADMDEFFLLPHDLIKNALPNLNTTENSDGSCYWHIKIIEPRLGEYYLLIPLQGENIPINEYKMRLTQ